MPKQNFAPAMPSSSLSDDNEDGNQDQYHLQCENVEQVGCNRSSWQVSSSSMASRTTHAESSANSSDMNPIESVNLSALLSTLSPHPLAIQATHDHSVEGMEAFQSSNANLSVPSYGISTSMEDYVHEAGHPGHEEAISSMLHNWITGVQGERSLLDGNNLSCITSVEPTLSARSESHNFANQSQQECQHSTNSHDGRPIEPTLMNLTKKRKKQGGCRCQRSNCLKLYCECFHSKTFCIDACGCQDCFNRPSHQGRISDTIEHIETRKPNAFAPKIVQPERRPNVLEADNKHMKTSLRHRTGCNCRKSFCKKNYCECFKVGVGCSNLCRCEDCMNPYGRKSASSMESKEGRDSYGRNPCDEGSIDIVMPIPALASGSSLLSSSHVNLQRTSSDSLIHVRVAEVGQGSSALGSFGQVGSANAANAGSSSHSLYNFPEANIFPYPWDTLPSGNNACISSEGRDHSTQQPHLVQESSMLLDVMLPFTQSDQCGGSKDISEHAPDSCLQRNFDDNW